MVGLVADVIPPRGSLLKAHMEVKLLKDMEPFLSSLQLKASLPEPVADLKLSVRLRGGLVSGAASRATHLTENAPLAVQSTISQHSVNQGGRSRNP